MSFFESSWLPESEFPRVAFYDLVPLPRPPACACAHLALICFLPRAGSKRLPLLRHYHFPSKPAAFTPFSFFPLATFLASSHPASCLDLGNAYLSFLDQAEASPDLQAHSWPITLTRASSGWASIAGTVKRPQVSLPEQLGKRRVLLLKWVI